MRKRDNLGKLIMCLARSAWGAGWDRDSTCKGVGKAMSRARRNQHRKAVLQGLRGWMTRNMVHYQAESWEVPEE